MALEAKYRLDGESRMQELHDQLANLQVTDADQYDPARVNPGVAPHLRQAGSSR